MGWVAMLYLAVVPALNRRLSDQASPNRRLFRWKILLASQIRWCLWLSGISRSIAYNWSRPNMKIGVRIIHASSSYQNVPVSRKALRLGFDVNLIAIALQAIFGVSLQIIVHIWVMSKKGPLYVAMFKPIGIIFAVIMGIGFLSGSIYLGSVLGAAIAVIGFYAVIWGKSQEQAKEECEVYDDSESYSPLSLFWRTREWRNRIIAII
ncbi:WAT1-related protein [Glycine soja]